MGLFKQMVPGRRRAACVGTSASIFALSAGALLLAASSLGSAAQADEPTVVSLGSVPPAVAVRYGDLKLSSDRGARILLERLQRAALAVCPYADERDLSRAAVRDRCVREVMARAVQQVGSARVAAVYSAHAQHG